MSQDPPITKCAIYPAIGISRIGNAPADSPNDYYLAPEIPGKPAKVTDGYKDSRGRVKKQVACFRIYGLTEDGTVVRELTADEAQIEWRVQVANRKAGWYQFNNALDLDSYKRLSDTKLNIAQRLKHFDYRQDWLRDFGAVYQKKINSMVHQWSELGIIADWDVPENNEQEFLPNRIWVETDRGPFINDDPSFEQVKYAEKADEEQVAKAENQVIEKAGKVPAERPKRPRPVFGRGEL